MKNLELFELQAAIDWIILQQSELLKQQDFVDQELRRLDTRRAALEAEKRILEKGEYD